MLFRSISAIRNADLDGNAATTAAAGWTPLLVTPNHPEYPAAHGCVTSAEAEVLRDVLKTNDIQIDMAGATAGGTTLTTSRHYATVDDLEKEIVDARVYAGLHYRFSGEAGVALGKQVAQWDLEHGFQAK